MRVGIGYDIHRLVPKRPLILGGVEIPFHLGLLGHSDGDVLSHAICDALLGAMGKRDIGFHFPDTDKEYFGISSLKLLCKVSDMLEEEGFYIINIDSTILAQEPKLSPYIQNMQENIAKSLYIHKDRINIKAKTEEGLGAIGKSEAIAAYAVCLLKKVT